MQQSDFVRRLQQIVGAKSVLTKDSQTQMYRKGFRFGDGAVAAVALPQNLWQMWQVAEYCIAQDKIIIMQAANTGLTGGSTPAGDDYQREVVIISVNAIKGVQLINDGHEVVALPGSSLTELENALKPLGREPHSVIGSSCIGASVIGGVCNNSGGALVRRGPAFTEMALFAQVTPQGKLELINNLGIDLGNSPEQILRRLQQQDYSKQIAKSPELRNWADDYAQKIRAVDEATPARYNADPSYWHEASGCAGKVIVFAVRLSTFVAATNPQVFYIGTNSEQVLVNLRRAILTQLPQLPLAAEYMDRDCYDLTARFAKYLYLSIAWFGADKIPKFNLLKNKFDACIKAIPFLPNNTSDRILDWLGRCLPHHLPKRVRQFRQQYKHYLMLQLEQHQVKQMQQILDKHLAHTESNFFLCDSKEAKAVFLHRFAAGGSGNMYCSIKDKKDTLLSLDLSLRRNDKEWTLKLPEHLLQQLELKAMCGHFLCYVIHQYYVVKPGVDKKKFKQQVLAYLDSRKARYPAEHNVGHLYQASLEHQEFFKHLDPTNSLNPGIGLTSKQKNWQ